MVRHQHGLWQPAAQPGSTGRIATGACNAPGQEVYSGAVATTTRPASITTSELESSYPRLQAAYPPSSGGLDIVPAFARLPPAWSPEKSVLQKTMNAMHAKSWRQIDNWLLTSAQQEKPESGRLVRLDSTVTATLSVTSTTGCQCPGRQTPVLPSSP
jgi:hypothetical protein